MIFSFIYLIVSFSSKQGEVQYFIGVQLDGSEHVEPLHNCIPEETAKDSAKLVRENTIEFVVSCFRIDQWKVSFTLSLP